MTTPYTLLGFDNLNSHKPIAFITGGSRGIGKAIADELTQDYQIIIGTNQKPSSITMPNMAPANAIFKCDLSNTKQLSLALTTLVSQLPRLDVLIHSAGVLPDKYATVAELNPAEWETVYQINVFAPAYITQALLPLLRKQHGQIIFINSGAGFMKTNANSAIYSSSKHALRSLADAVRAEEKGLVKVTSLYPGRTATDMQIKLQNQLGNDYNQADHIQPSSIARTVRTIVDISADACIEDLSIRPF